MKIRVTTESLITVGKVLVGAGLAVTIPVIVLALLHVTGHSVNPETERKLLSFSAIGFAIVGTGGGAFVGHKVVTDNKHRVILAIAWTVQLCGVIFIGSTYLLMISEEVSVTSLDGESAAALLESVLPHFWMRVVYFVVIMATPEIGVVASLVCVADLLGTNAEIARLEEERDAKSTEVDTLRGELDELKGSMEKEIQKRVKDSMQRSAEDFQRSLSALEESLQHKDK